MAAEFFWKLGCQSRDALNEVLGNPSPTISRNAVGAWAGSQRLIPAYEIWIADAHRGDGNRFVVHADELLTAFVELESATSACGELA